MYKKHIACTNLEYLLDRIEQHPSFSKEDMVLSWHNNAAKHLSELRDWFQSGHEEIPDLHAENSAEERHLGEWLRSVRVRRVEIPFFQIVELIDLLLLAKNLSDKWLKWIVNNLPTKQQLHEFKDVASR
ncbi:hypothetical protein NO2_1693 [Candidatus Termititenax persephonae]|uniref:Uncharacterized protein n=1 Tax=Candidatus Termititenax persephonae TaxID=2218525 RepID=A0A388TJQ6_9BACT|nr:hypothetical protein NO2_1693 [Candidatus Termititenax persephonae]